MNWEIVKKYKNIFIIILIIVILVIGIISINNNDNFKEFLNTINFFDSNNQIDQSKDNIKNNNDINNGSIVENKDKDTDNDGLLDSEEIALGTDPLDDDTDDDGLLDGKAQYINDKIIAPIDPKPLTYSGPIGIWKKQIEAEKSGNIPTYLTDYYQYTNEDNKLSKVTEINWNSLNNDDNLFQTLIKSPYMKELASNTLRFRLDNGGVVLHSQTQEDLYTNTMNNAKKKLDKDKYGIFLKAVEVLEIEEEIETWQKEFGYNFLYDVAFRYTTNDNMRSAQLYFEDERLLDYTLWLWRGDYLALGSGAEMGIYKKRDILGKTHWDAVEFTVPMTLNLYNYYGENNIQKVFNWNPKYKQWWVTGFNTEYHNVDVKKQVLIGSVNFDEHIDMYNSLKEPTVLNSPMYDYIYFDDNTKTIWICWYE